MIDLAVVVPQPPLLVPELAAGGSAETAPLRVACLDAVARLAAGATRWVAVGVDDGGRRSVPATTRGSFRGFGIAVEVALAPEVPGPADVRLPLPLLVAGWLRERVAPAAAVIGELIDPDADPHECRDLGARLAAHPEPTGLLVVGDGAATHSARSPGHLDERASAFDAAVAAALAAADPSALLGIDPRLAAELTAVGRGPWQVLAGAAQAGGEWIGELCYSAAPYGVAYHVAVWSRRR